MTIKNFSLKRFLKLDIRWKLRRIGKKIGISLYPNSFNFKGIKNLYSYFIFNLIFFEKILKKKRLLIQRIKLVSTKNKKKVNFIYCLPSCGSNYLRNFLSSYFEIRYKIGNGIPKFDNYSDNRWFYSDSPIIMSDLYTNINIEIFERNNDWEFYNKDQFLSERVGISRHPLKQLDLFEINETKPLVLIRDPYDWIYSIYVRKYKSSFYKDLKFKECNTKIIEDSIKRFHKFYDFWIYNLKNKNKNEFLVINFKSLVENEKTFLKILNFFKIPVEKDHINNSIKINSKEFTKSYLGFDFKGTRFANISEKNEIKELIKDYVSKRFEETKVQEKYNELNCLIT